MTISPLEKFQILLRERFRFDCADLDFGIYRIMNHKRQVIERFITEDLPQAIAEELTRGAGPYGSDNQGFNRERHTRCAGKAQAVKRPCTGPISNFS